MTRLHSIALLLLGVLVVAPGDRVSAQAPTSDPPTHTLILRDVLLSDALEQVAALTGIDLLYGAEVSTLARERRVFCRAEDQPVEEILSCVVESAEVDYYRLSSGTYVVIEGPEGLPQYTSLTGVVTDRWTGQPLPAAQIRMENPGTWTRANEAGIFSLASLLPGRHNVLVSSYGYRPLRTTVEVPERGLGRVSFSLEPELYRARPIIVDGLDPGWRGARLAGGGVLDREDFLGEARAGRSYEGALPRILGVARRPFLSDVLIQGGETITQQLRLDGVPIYSPLSVEGIVGPFSPLALERLTVRKAGFPARHGSATAGILDLEQATHPPDGRRSEIQIDPHNVNGRISLPLPGANDLPGALTAAGRSSLWNVFTVPALDQTLREWNQVDPLLAQALQGAYPSGAGIAPSEAVDYRGHDHGSDVGSTDLHLAVRIPTGPGRAFRGSLYRGASEISTRLLAAGHHESHPVPDRLMIVEDGYDWSNLAGRVRYDGLLGDRTTTGIQLHASRHRFASGNRMAQADPYGSTLREMEEELSGMIDGQPFLTDASRIHELGAEASLERALGPGHRLLGKLEVVRVEAELSLDGGAFPHLRTEAAHTRAAAVVEDRWNRGPVTLEGGLRSTWLPGSETLVHEPRVALEVQGERAVPVTARLAGGIYRQFVSEFELANPGPSALVPSIRFWLPFDEELPLPSSRHLSLEVAALPAPNWELRGEVFGRWTDDLPVVDYASLLAGGWDDRVTSPGGLAAPTSGEAVGLGLRASRSGELLRVHAGYDATRSRRTFSSRFGGEAVPDPADAPHRALARVEVAATPGITLRARGSGTWGRSWAFRRAYYDLLTLHDARSELDVGRPGDRTLPALLELDVGASWAGRVGDLDMELSVDLLNALDRRNVLDYGLRRVADAQDDFELIPRYLAGRSPALTLRVSF